MRTNDDLVDDIEHRASAYLGDKNRSPAVLQALRRVDRKFFLSVTSPGEIYTDQALSIGCGQTCSEPSMVAFMLDILELEEGHRLLEIGAGSGYAAAAASLLCGHSGIVYACEILPSLAEEMEARLRAWSRDLRHLNRDFLPGRIEIISADGSAGFPEHAPYDRILLSAGVAQIRMGVGFRAQTLLDQLVEGGVLVYPETLGSLFRIRNRKGSHLREEWPGVAFVPLRGRNA